MADRPRTTDDRPGSNGTQTPGYDDEKTHQAQASTPCDNPASSITRDLEQGSVQTPSHADDANIVGWDSDDDPLNPQNWPTRKKFINCALVSCLTLLAPLASSAFAPGTPQLLHDFNSKSSELSSFVLSVYVLGYAVGPMIAAPMSEMYGRFVVYLVTNIGFVAFLAGCALAPSISSFVAFRFFSGAFGSCVISNGGGTLADIVRLESRARVMAAFSVVPMLGPIVGPIMGGFLVASKGWRWVFWVLVMVAGTLTISMALFTSESYAPVLLEQKTRMLRRETGNTRLRSELDKGLTHGDLFKQSIVRPYYILFCSPLVLIFATYMLVVYGYLYLLFTSVSVVFQETYGFSTSSSGLVFISFGLGSITSLIWHSWTSDGDATEQLKKDEFEPEFRLKLLPYASFSIPIGLFIYGWTAQYHVHWIAPLIGLYFFGLGQYNYFHQTGAEARS
ncbi:Efflux pump rdc3 [Lasiodiplodia theobromae]|uniref:Efflux pump rdc3 n=1 Tax=Lasiodiplodia theobromae TaxID=45133 RepID=A0A5N5D700_9PEZI|nr:Efflux pump rdc3 [Lasiodiplodia theobromae]